MFVCICVNVFQFYLTSTACPVICSGPCSERFPLSSCFQTRAIDKIVVFTASLGFIQVTSLLELRSFENVDD